MNKQPNISKNEEAMWKSKNGLIPMEEMSDEHLQKAFSFACVKELKHFNIAMTMGRVTDSLREAADKRGLSLKYPNELAGGEKYNGYFKSKKKAHERTRVNPLDAQS